MKTKHIPSAIPIYIAALVWILYGLALPLFEIAHILMAAGLSVVAYLAAGKFIPGRTVEVAPPSGDAEIDAQLEKCARPTRPSRTRPSAPGLRAWKRRARRF